MTLKSWKKYTIAHKEKRKQKEECGIFGWKHTSESEEDLEEEEFENDDFDNNYELYPPGSNNPIPISSQQLKQLGFPSSSITKNKSSFSRPGNSLLLPSCLKKPPQSSCSVSGAEMENSGANSSESQESPSQISQSEISESSGSGIGDKKRSEENRSELGLDSGYLGEGIERAEEINEFNDCFKPSGSQTDRYIKSIPSNIPQITVRSEDEQNQ